MKDIASVILYIVWFAVIIIHAGLTIHFIREAINEKNNLNQDERKYGFNHISIIYIIFIIYSLAITILFALIPLFSAD